MQEIVIVVGAGFGVILYGLLAEQPILKITKVDFVMLAVPHGSVKLTATLPVAGVEDVCVLKPE